MSDTQKPGSTGNILDVLKHFFTSRVGKLLILLLIILAIPLTVFIAGQQQETRQRASNNSAPACDANQVQMDVSPTNIRVGDTFTISLGGSQGSTFIGNSFTPQNNITCDPFRVTWPASTTCHAVSAGNIVWTHTWKNCLDNDTLCGNGDQARASTQCSKPLSITIIATTAAAPTCTVSFTLPTGQITPNTPLTIGVTQGTYTPSSFDSSLFWQYNSLYEVDGNGAILNRFTCTNAQCTIPSDKNTFGMHKLRFAVRDAGAYGNPAIKIDGQTEDKIWCSTAGADIITTSNAPTATPPLTPTPSPTTGSTATPTNTPTAGPSPTATPTGITFERADFNHSGCVNIGDFNTWLSAFRTGVIQQGTFPDVVGTPGVADILDFNFWYNAMLNLPQSKLCSS